MISLVTAPLQHGADVTILVQIGNTVFPGSFEHVVDSDELRVWVDAESPDDDAKAEADETFRIALGILRVWKPATAGELREEWAARSGYGNARDTEGNTWVFAGSALAYAVVGGDVERLATRARNALANSQHLRNALWLNGRAHRNAADLWMICEYAGMEFKGPDGIERELGFAVADQRLLKKSADNLAPRAGGRHAGEKYTPPWTLDEQHKFVAELLLRWIAKLGT